MKVIVRAKAEDDIDHIFAWIARDNISAATDMVVHIRARINRLATPALSHMGHPGHVKGTLEIIVRPYIIVYKIFERRREIVVLSVVHGAREGGPVRGPAPSPTDFCQTG